jgi:pilus assembly protein CpaF
MSLENGDYKIQDLFGFEQRGSDDRGIARGHFYATGNKPAFLKRLNQLGIEMPESLFAQRQLTPDMSIGPMTTAAALEMQEQRA